MDAREAIILNLRETIRRSIKLWRSLPNERMDWKPDKDAMSFGTYNYLVVIKNNGFIDEKDPQAYKNEPIVSVEKEIQMSEPNFEDFILYVESLTEEDLSTRIIDRSYVSYKRFLGDMLLRIAYHDAVQKKRTFQLSLRFFSDRFDILIFSKEIEHLDSKETSRSE